MKRVVLIDGNSLMYKAYFATAYSGNLMKNSKGLYTNAIFAFCNMFENIMNTEYDYILVAFDKGKKTFRHDLLESYKGGRSPMPEELRLQIPFIKEFLDVVKIKRYEVDLYEADDIIGTIANEASLKDFHVDIYSSDKDLLQLINKNTDVHLSKRGLTDTLDLNVDNFYEHFNIRYDQFIDYKAIMGDPSDNLPGISGVGEKTAVKLLSEYDSLDNIINNVDLIKGKLQEKIRAGIDQVKLCRQMVKIKTDSPLEIGLEDCIKKEYDDNKLIDFYQNMEFHSLIKRKTTTPIYKTMEYTYQVIDKNEEIKKILLPNSSLIFETFGENYHQDELIAIGLKNKLGNFIINPKMLDESIDFRLYLEDEMNKKHVYNAKKCYVLCMHHNINLSGVSFDMLLASYILNPSIAKEEMRQVASYFDYNNVEYEEVIYGKGAKKALPKEEILYEHIVKKTTCLYLLKNNLIKELKENEQYELFSEIELPLSLVLAKMEVSGIRIDLNELKVQTNDIYAKIKNIEQEIYRLANKEFNIASPKQLGEVLFDDLALPFAKKTKTGYATNIEVLENLRPYHPIIPYIMEYRTLTKLYSTYLEGMKQHIYSDHKLHTIYQQALTQTGRLSSIEPNLQNIPIRYEEGKNIRKMFIPTDDTFEFLAADYSQIELRVLASLANVKELIKAFNDDHDIHTETAKKIFKKEDITYDDRRKAKAVNFGIIYGMSSWGLATDLHISAKEAENFIASYYEVYPEIKVYMDGLLEEAKEKGYVKTIKNRKRFIPELKSPVYQMREFGKRTAMNAPIQGSAADIIKLAMIKLDENLKKEKLASRIILQVHDELILEVKKDEHNTVIKLVKDAMENAIKLKVPLKIEYDFGDTWFEVD